MMEIACSSNTYTFLHTSKTSLEIIRENYKRKTIKRSPSIPIKNGSQEKKDLNQFTQKDYDELYS